MPFNRKIYPANWEAFTAWIKFARALGQCECTGQCGQHTRPHPTRCVERNREPGRFMRGRVILTTAHLCKCSPPCAIEAHVIAACQKCHLRIDSREKANRRRQKLEEKAKMVTEATCGLVELKFPF